MEIFAGFVEHTDVAGRHGSSTAGGAAACATTRSIFYIFGDNGSSAEGQQGIDQRAARAEQHPEHGRAADRGAGRIGGLDALGSAEDRQHVPCRLGLGRQHAVQGHQARGRVFRRHAQPDGGLVAGRIKPDARRRARSSTMSTTSRRRSTTSSASRRPKVVNGFEQIPIDGVSMAYTFGDAAAPGRKHDAVFRQQRQPRHLPRRLVSLRAKGPFIPWDTPGSAKRLPDGIPTTDQWELYDLQHATSRRPTTSPPRNPEKLDELKKQFLEVAEDNKDFPIGAGNWLRIHPEDRVKTPYDELDLRPEHAPHAGIRRARASAGRAPRS